MSAIEEAELGKDISNYRQLTSSVCKLKEHIKKEEEDYYGG